MTKQNYQSQDPAAGVTLNSNDRLDFMLLFYSYLRGLFFSPKFWLQVQSFTNRAGQQPDRRHSG